MICAGVHQDEIQRIVNSVRMATLYFDLDWYVMPPEYIAVREENGTLGSICCGVTDGDHQFYDEGTDEFSLIWSRLPEDVRSSRTEDLFRLRHDARRQCIVRSPDFSERLKESFAAWRMTNPAIPLQLPSDMSDLVLAHELSRVVGLDPALKSYGIDVHLRQYLTDVGAVGASLPRATVPYQRRQIKQPSLGERADSSHSNQKIP
jgi:hypothetical protein